MRRTPAGNSAKQLWLGRPKAPADQAGPMIEHGGGAVHSLTYKWPLSGGIVIPERNALMRPADRQIFELCVLAVLACAGVGFALSRNETIFAAVFAAQATFAVGIAIGLSRHRYP